MSAIEVLDRSKEGAAQNVERAQLEKARQGDREAQAWLIERHQDTVYGLAHRLTGGNPDRAEELAQEAFLRALRALPRFRGEASFGTWMHRIVVNLHINRESTLAARARRRMVSVGPDEDSGGTVVELEDPHPELQPDARVSAAEQKELLLRALEELEEDRRTVVVLRDLEGYSYEEIAEQLVVPIGTVRSRLCRAREQLRDRLLAGSGAWGSSDAHPQRGLS